MGLFPTPPPISPTCRDEASTRHPPVEAPPTTEYTCDVLVVGGGLTGLNAAYAAASAGKSVILAEKGTPGYCGLSAWPSCTAYYDPELDADMDTWDHYMRNSCDCFANLNWEDAWCAESKEAFERLQQWGWIQSYDRAADTEFWVDGNIYHDDLKGYKNSVPDRRRVFCQVLDDNGVTTLDHIMITDIVEENGVCMGAVGLHYQSETFVSIAAKAVVLATGNGVIKPMGYPIGSDTYDGVWIGYNHGPCPSRVLEFEDFHMTTSYAPSNSLTNNAYPYLEPVWPTGGTVSAESMSKQKKVNERYTEFANGFNLEYNDITLMDGEESGAAASVASTNGNESDPRKGKMTSPLPKGHVYGAACRHECAHGGGHLVWRGRPHLRDRPARPLCRRRRHQRLLRRRALLRSPARLHFQLHERAGLPCRNLRRPVRRRRRRRDASASRGGSSSRKRRCSPPHWSAATIPNGSRKCCTLSWLRDG